MEPNARVRGMSRAVPEWKGKTPDSKVPGAVKLRILNAAGGKCYLSGLPIGSKPWHVEHVKPLSMGGENRETNLKPALVDAHKEKTKKEASIRAKADAIAKRAAGITAPTQKIQSPGFRPPDKESKREAKAAFYQGLARRAMFEERPGA